MGLDLETLLQTIAAGLLVGCTYGLMCVSLGLIFGIMRLINFAQGDFLMTGMYFALVVVAALGLLATGFPVLTIVLAGLAAIPVFFALGWCMHWGLIGRIDAKGSGLTEGEAHQAQLIVTLGISLVLANGALMVFGSSPRSLATPLASQAWPIHPTGNDDVIVFLNKARIIAACVALAMTFGLHLLLRRTAFGRNLRAAADNPAAATYMGIDVPGAHRTAFGLGFALTAVAGVTVATFYPFQPYVGLDFVVVMYAGVVLGGLGSVSGSFWGGLTIGLVQQMSSLVLPMRLQSATVFVVFLLILLLRPQGFFGRSVERA